MVNGIKPLDLI